MNALNHLASLLQASFGSELQPYRPCAEIDVLLNELNARVKTGGGREPIHDHQLDAVRRYWHSQKVPTFRDAYLLSFGLCIPHRPRGECVMEDRPRFLGVLDSVDGYLNKTASYRRCYQGLAKSYFTYDVDAANSASTGKRNWLTLRDYLHDRVQEIRDSRQGPAWVDTAIQNSQLFDEAPCNPYVEQLLRGDESHINRICEQLQIGKESWFLRRLVLEQVERATGLGDKEFVSLLPRVLGLLAHNEVLRDQGTILVLDRYAKVLGNPLHPELRDHAVAWWGNPWLPSNATRWGGVATEARTMVSDWLKLEFIETFFTKLAEDGLADPRRMKFWKRYVKSIDDIEFALGSSARNSREPDLVALRKKMKGLTRELDASGANNAFIMTMGKLVAVEFSGLGNAFYGYDAGHSLPFDTSTTLRLGRAEPNSLKQSSRLIWLKHGDGIHGWNQWEDMFEATLRDNFQIRPSLATDDISTKVGITTESRNLKSFAVSDDRAQSVQGGAKTHGLYSHTALKRLAEIHSLQIDDKTALGGNLWVRGDESDEGIGRILADWGFRLKPGKGWWK
ncbi:EH signature domain-containing protein [Robbsia andropogonis]|uniref:EH signature domain-containing protein n=1 Tax=Robbsia andropogonis TaxID=28092 RepID=UPI00209EA9DB|nr:EH signature domain-containing protein [Robbsia andropogonis]MCP1118905.1 EH signature domain-containing protein [Robbsia andropogonis]MCP1128743.1 EH signature domain-containing protein [Robbsia andropogonis]